MSGVDGAFYLCAASAVVDQSRIGHGLTLASDLFFQRLFQFLAQRKQPITVVLFANLLCDLSPRAQRLHPRPLLMVILGQAGAGARPRGHPGIPAPIEPADLTPPLED